MPKEFHTVLFLFRRDLRLEDNTGLIYALQCAETVIPAFIFTPEQIERNPLKNAHCIQFMLQSLCDLSEQLKEKGGRLYLFKGKADGVVRRCIRELGVEAVMVNRDYTPYSRQRDELLEKVCQEKGVSFYAFDDALLHPPERTVKKDGKPYTIFTPYFRNAAKIKVLPPQKNRWSNYFRGAIPFAEKPLEARESSSLKGGRNEALKILKGLKGGRKKGLEDSTHLSPYLKFTVCSPREVYRAAARHHDLIRSLYWRDFFTSIAWFFPHVFKGAFHSKFNQISWSQSKKAYQRWYEGRTGFPIVDAGMREMNKTGFMPNRIRMIVASLLIKDLQISWQWGERYFAKMLIDYDPAVNNGNWQWVASTGCDAQPYFRVFNPWTQQKKFDPQCHYIKKWIPELRSLPPEQIHKWGESHTPDVPYPPPMVDHTKAAQKAISLYARYY